MQTSMLNKLVSSRTMFEDFFVTFLDKNVSKY